MTTTADAGANGAIDGAIKAAWEAAVGIEPARGKIAHADMKAVRDAIEKLAAAMSGLSALDADDRASTEGTIATVYARSAAVAIASGDEITATRWLNEAERLSKDDDQLGELKAASRGHERYRALVHGRNLIAHSQESAARKAWNAVVKAGRTDAIGQAAVDELKAPRPLDGASPTLYRLNGFGAGFYGRRDHWKDGSYATTHCISAVWIPVFPLAAYRVRDSGSNSYTLMAREQLSPFARLSRWALLAGVAVLIAGFSINSYVNDPHRIAQKRWDAALDADGDPETRLKRIDSELERDSYLIGAAQAEHAGAQVVTLSARDIAKPFTRGSLDQATRVVRKFQALPSAAQGGEARAAMNGLLDAWLAQVGDGLDTADVKLALLDHEADIDDTSRAAEITTKIAATRLAVARSKSTDWPLDALAVLVDQAKDTAALAEATKIVARLVDSPSLLLDAGPDLDTWLAAMPTDDALATKVTAARELATQGRDDADGEAVTVKQLTAMQKARPWDQHVTLALARADASTGKVDAAIARLSKLGTPGMTIRNARFLLGQLQTSTGKLEAADATLTSLLGDRLTRFATASAALQDALKGVQDRIKIDLDTGNVPADLRTKVDAATTEADRRAVVDAWAEQQMDGDDKVKRAHDAFVAYGDVVPVSIAAGSVKLRRAEAMSGSARNSMLEDAEHTFLAVKTAGEDQPEYQLGLGAIYARLGKTAESDAEFDAVLAKSDPTLSLQVAGVYREIGSVEKATKVATDLFGQAAEPTKTNAAIMLAMLATDEDDTEAWYRKADQSVPFVKTSLLQIEGQRLLRQGKHAECAVKFAEVARAHLATVTTANRSGYNNAANADSLRFACSGDMQALRDAEAAQELAYRTQPDDPIVVGNLGGLLQGDGKLRVLAKRIDVRAFRPDHAEADDLIRTLLDSPEHDALAADLAADPGVRRSGEMFAQYEVLAPNTTSAYEAQFSIAYDNRDEVVAAAIVDRARKAKALDVSDDGTVRARWVSGASDAKYFEDEAGKLARFDEALAQPKLDAKTRAAVLYLEGDVLWKLGVYKRDAALIARGRDALIKAMAGWPALDTNGSIAGTLIDEAGLAADPDAWVTARRTRSAADALSKLAGDHAPVADKIRASKQWAEVPAYLRADTTRRGINDVRLARLLGDAALEARAKVVFDDKLTHLSAELHTLVSPTDPTIAEDLAFLDKH